MNEDILYLLLQAENEYHAAMKNAVKDAEDYSDECRKKQAAYIEELKQKWHLFEDSEKSKLEKMLFENGQKLEIKAAELKERLRTGQKKKADQISERLKKEVLSLYGDR